MSSWGAVAGFVLGTALLGQAQTSASPRAAAEAARNALAAGDARRAEELLTPALMRTPGDVELTYTMALVQYNRGEFALSQATLERIPASARDANAFDLLAWCYHRQGRAEEAVAAMRQALKLDTANGQRYTHLAQILLEENHYRAAHQAAVEATRLPGGGAAAYRIQAAVETASGMMKQAADSAARAVQLDAKDPEARLSLAVAQEGLWQYREARATLERAIQEFPSYVRLYVAYGRLLLDAGAPWDAGEREAAVTMFEQALTRDAALPDAQAVLGEYLLRTGRVQRALPHLEAAAKLSPRDARVCLMLSSAYRLTGREAESAAELRVFQSLRAQGAK